MSDPSVITQGPRASKSSGERALADIAYGIIHVSDDNDPTKGAAQVASYFHSATASGSAHFVCDNENTVQCLPLEVVPWGAPPLNPSGVHIEQSGSENIPRAKWLTTYDGQFTRVAWLMAHLSAQLKIPLVWLQKDDLLRLGVSPGQGKGGWTTHAAVTDAWRKSDHRDPGPGYPIELLMPRAQTFLAAMVPPKA